MPLMDELGIDPTTLNAGEIEEQMKAGGLPPEGMHHAVLQGFREGNANNGRKYRELVFHILAGPAKGMEVKESLWNSDDQRGKNRAIIFAHRLGLLTKKDGKYAAVPGKAEFSDVIGATCIIDVKHEEYERKDGKGKGQKAILSFEGVLSLDDARAKDVPRGNAAAAASAAAAAGAAAKKKEDFSDL